MENRRAVAIGGVILVVGACAALPFQRTTAEDPLAARRPSDAPRLLLDEPMQTSPRRLPLAVPGGSAQVAQAVSPGRSAVEPPALHIPQRRTATSLPRLEGSFPDAGVFSEPPAHGESIASASLRGEPIARPPARAEPKQTVTGSELSRIRTHRVRDGDTLPALAARYLGAASRWREIYAANREQLHDPDLLPLNMELRIPTTGPASGRTPRSHSGSLPASPKDGGPLPASATAGVQLRLPSLPGPGSHRADEGWNAISNR